MDNTTPAPAMRVRAFLVLAKAAIAREAATLPQTLTSWTFLFVVLAPFCVWSGLLLWFRVPYSAWHASAVGGTLDIVLLVWTLAAGMWIPAVMGPGRYRHAATVFLALSVITTIRGCITPLTPPNSRTAVHDRAADDLPPRLGD